MRPTPIVTSFGYRSGWLGLLSVVGLGLAAVPTQSAEIDIQDIPVFLLETAPPNVVLTLDDSARMHRAYSPERLSEGTAEGRASIFTSPQTNALYYSPRRSYPPALNAHGASLGNEAFANARRNLFRDEACSACGDACPESCSAVPGAAYGFSCLTDLGDDYAAFRDTTDERCGPFLPGEIVPDTGHPDYELWLSRGFTADDWGALCAGDTLTYEGAAVDLACPAYYSVFDPTNAPGECVDPSFPNETTPDICFDRIEVGSAADLAYAYCEGEIADAECEPRDDTPLLATGETAEGVNRDELSRRNFANWYAYYRDRLSLTKTTLSRVMYRLAPSVRFGYDGVAENPDGGGSGFANTFSINSLSAMRDFYDWLFAQPASGASRLFSATREARAFFGAKAGTDPNALAYVEDVAAYRAGSLPPDNNPEHGCRNNFHMIASDGGWEDGGDPGSPANADAATWTLPEPAPDRPDLDWGIVEYTPRAPFADANAGTLADEAFRSWVNDLRPDLDNDVPPILRDLTGTSGDVFWNPINDPATWQHVTTLTVGIGVDGNVAFVDGSLATPDGDWSYTDDQGEVRTGTLAVDGFPGPWSSDGTAAGLEPWKTDDLWHAGINGRGGYFNAKDPEGLTAAFEDALDIIAAATADAAVASPAFNLGSLGGETLIFTATLDTSDWSGDLVARGVSAGFGTGLCPGQAPGELCAGPPNWSAAGLLDDRPWSDRAILTLGANGATIPFAPSSWDSLTQAQQDALKRVAVTDHPMDAETQAKELMDYIRGDASFEARNLPATAKLRFRNRASKLADIINSSPAVVGPPSRMYTDNAYDAFRSNPTYVARDTVIYVGSNGGMMHAFDAGLADSGGGRELFAYVPSFIYPKLHELTDLGYDHEAYVDGPIAEGDVYIDGAWETVILGSGGIGGQGVYALKVTDPGSITTGNPKGLSLWEFSDQSYHENMGYLLGRPAIARIREADGEPQWVAVFGNGYNSSIDDGSAPIGCRDPVSMSYDATGDQGEGLCGQAVLFVVDIATGALVKEYQTGVGRKHDPELDVEEADRHPRALGLREQGAGRPNGLGAATLIDADGDLVADAAYAGDLFGNVWKFDLRDLAKAPVRLFTAKDANGRTQPITAPINIAPHPTGKGALLLFGTGFLLGRHEPDFESRMQQTFYGIWDDGSSTFLDGQLGRAPGANGGSAKLQVQTFVDLRAGNQDGSNSNVTEGRVTSDNSVDWTVQRGWYLDLPYPQSGNATSPPTAERVTTKAEVRGNRVLFVSTIPADDPCEAGGGSHSWVNALDLRDGSRLAITPFDFNLDFAFGVDDLFEISENGATVTAAGSSIRLPGTGVYSGLATLDLGGGGIKTVLADSRGDLVSLQESTALDWRNWQRLR
jgi:type IV pilus assembly protein PilY1